MDKNIELMTLGEFAAEIGVSSAAVSAVFNNRYKERRISEKTVEFIRSESKRLGFHPNIAARRLRIQKDLQVCQLAVVTSFESPFPLCSNIVSAIEYTVKKNYKHITPFVEIVMFNSGRISELPGILDGSRFNGAVVINTGFADDDFFRHNEVLYPIVFIGRDIEGYSCIRDDDFSLGVDAAKELIRECGCKKLAIVKPCSNLLTQSTKNRSDGFIKESQSSGVECDVICAQGINEKSAVQAVSEYLESQLFDGVFCVSDVFSIGAYYAIKNKGLSIPKDVAVVGIGDLSFVQYLDPPLTTFNVTNSHIKDDYAAEKLLNQLYSKRSSVESRIFHPGIIRRASTQRN